MRRRRSASGAVKAVRVLAAERHIFGGLVVQRFCQRWNRSTNLPSLVGLAGPVIAAAWAFFLGARFGRWA